MIDIEQCALCALEQHAGPAAAILVEQFRDIAHQGLQHLPQGKRIIEHLLETQWLLLKVVLQHEVVIVDDLAKLGRKALPVKQIAKTQGAPRDLVFVRRSDPAPRGPNRGLSARLFAREIELHVVGQD